MQWPRVKGGSGATTTIGISTGYSAAQDVPGLDDGSCKKCVQVGELTCSRYHRTQLVHNFSMKSMRERGGFDVIFKVGEASEKVGAQFLGEVDARERRL